MTFHIGDIIRAKSNTIYTLTTTINTLTPALVISEEYRIEKDDNYPLQKVISLINGKVWVIMLMFPNSWKKINK